MRAASFSHSAGYTAPIPAASNPARSPPMRRPARPSRATVPTPSRHETSWWPRIVSKPSERRHGQHDHVPRRVVGPGDRDALVERVGMHEPVAVGQQVGAPVVVVRVARDAVDLLPAERVAEPHAERHEADDQQRQPPRPARPAELRQPGHGLDLLGSGGRLGPGSRLDVRPAPSATAGVPCSGSTTPSAGRSRVDGAPSARAVAPPRQALPHQAPGETSQARPRARSQATGDGSRTSRIRPSARS